MTIQTPTDALRLVPDRRPLWVNGDYTPSEDMVEAGRDFMPRNVSEENVVRAFMEMMKQAEIDGLITYADKTNATGLDEAQRKAVERAAMDAGADVWRHCRLAMVADGEIIGYPCFSRADMAELARLYEAAPALPLPEGGGQCSGISGELDPRLVEWGYTSLDEAITHLGKLLDDQAAFDGLAAPTGAK